MKMTRMSLFGAMVLGVAACYPTDEPGSDSIAGAWNLQTMNGENAPDGVTFAVDGTGFSGKSVCNNYFGALSGTLPEFSTGQIASSLMACPGLDGELAYFQTLEAVTTAQVSGDTLTLSDTSGPRLVFTRAD